MFNLFSKKHESPHFTKLREIALFADLTTRELGIIQGALHYREYVKDEIVFDEGEEGQAIYFLFVGKVVVCRRGPPAENVIAELAAGELFGELALLDNSPRSAQVRAAENCTIAALFREDFLALLETHAKIASKISLQLSRYLAKRLRQAIPRDAL